MKTISRQSSSGSLATMSSQVWSQPIPCVYEFAHGQRMCTSAPLACGMSRGRNARVARTSFALSLSESFCHMSLSHSMRLCLCACHAIITV
jgi:hypothetical protein